MNTNSMNPSFSDSAQLLGKAKDSRLYDALIAQLKKDFRRVNIDIVLPEKILAEALFHVLQEKVYVLLMENFPVYLNLLYAIDVPEEMFREIEMTDAVEVAGQVSFLILKRELQKVSLRQKYDV